MPAPLSPMEVREIADPVVAPGGILLRTVASEVCGTDVHIHRGQLAGVPYPIIPGHVSVGQILELRDVTHDALGRPLRAGDVVTFYDVHGVCGRCWYCTVAEQSNRCPSRRVYGITYSVDDGPFGGWAERIYLQPGVRVLRLPGSLDAETVIGGGCGLFTGYAAVERSALAMGDVVVVQGTGPVGLAAVAFARLRGAGAICAVGEPASRRDLASLMGADRTLALTEDQSQRMAAVHELTGGRGADVVIEASGNPQALPEGLALLRDGGTYVVAGHYADAGEVAINPHLAINRKHADVRGQWGTAFRHVVRALSMLERYRERLPFAKAIGGRYGLAEAGRALEDVAALRVTKAIIAP